MRALVVTLSAALLATTALAPTALAQSAPPHMPTDLSPAGVRAADEHLALEEVNGTEAMAFVASENEKSLKALTGDPRYEGFRQQAFDILSATDRIAAPSFLGEGIGNFWQDATNPKGLWRRTSLDSYRSATPQWETLIDLDALSKTEGKDWVWKGADCLAPDETRCLISLSDGGKDAVVVREFDTSTKTFVDGGFSLPEGKHRIEWLDRNTLLVATDFGAGTLTESGYPFIVKSLGRGQTLEQATEIFRGAPTDGGYGVSPRAFRNGDGVLQAVIVSRPLDTFRGENWLVEPSGTTKLELPDKVTVHGMIDKRLVFTPDQDWTRRGNTRTAGSLLAVSLNVLRPAAKPATGVGVGDIYVSTEADTIIVPTARQSIEDVTVLDDKVVVTLYDNVTGSVVAFNNNATQPWTRTVLPAAENAAVHLGSSSRKTGRVFYTFEGFLTPPTLALSDLVQNTANVIRSAPARFDASKDVVEQFEATSTDGTKIPYFVVRPKDAPMDGSTPTIMFGYGGFQVAFPPAYKPEMGKLWLENGGAFVIANIRGGGEFGPAWHDAVLRENRQLAFDDFAAVGRDLEDRKITSPRRLGIYGRSNGGVLTSVSITQHPELFNAAVIESPLIDMLRYWELPAGASWIGEYGDPRVPADAAFIARYSGYQNLKPDARYPRVYITTNTRDDRVHPGHARKFAARLGDMGYDHLYYEETSGGHSNDADPVANARRWARHYTYLSQQLMD